MVEVMSLRASAMLMFFSLFYTLFISRVFLLLIRVLTKHFICTFILGTASKSPQTLLGYFFGWEEGTNMPLAFLILLKILKQLRKILSIIKCP